MYNGGTQTIARDPNNSQRPEYHRAGLFNSAVLQTLAPTLIKLTCLSLSSDLEDLD